MGACPGVRAALLVGRTCITHLWRYIAGPVCSDGAPCMQATHRPAVATSARTVEQRLVALQGEARHTLPETVQSMEHRALRVAYFLAA